MNDSYCSNYQICRLVTTNAVSEDIKQKINYIRSFCETEKKTWQGCKRFQTKSALGFCPDFVLPDTDISIDEIIEKFDNERKN
jgi:hypothetical protein